MKCIWNPKSHLDSGSTFSILTGFLCHWSNHQNNKEPWWVDCIQIVLLEQWVLLFLRLPPENGQKFQKVPQLAILWHQKSTHLLPFPLLPISEFMNFTHAQHVFAIPISWWQDNWFIQEIIDSIQQFFPLFNPVANIMKLAIWHQGGKRSANFMAVNRWGIFGCQK